MTLVISSTILHQIRRYAEEHYPEEGVGLILGRLEDEQRIAMDLLPVANEFAPEARRRRYAIEPSSMLAAEEEADRRGLLVLGVFHSHPDHPAQASEYDRQRAVPWFTYLITSVEAGHAGESRAWRLDEGQNQMVEEALHITPWPKVQEVE